MSQNALLRIQNLKSVLEKRRFSTESIWTSMKMRSMCSWVPTAPENPHWALL